MNPKRKGIADRVGAWSAAHRKTAILGWLAFVVVALMFGGSIGTKELTGSRGHARRGRNGRADAGRFGTGAGVGGRAHPKRRADRRRSGQFSGTVDDLTSGLGEVDAVGS